MDNRPFVAVCLPCQDEVKTEFAMSLAALFHCSNYRLALIRGSSSIVMTARNICLESLETLEEMVKRRFDWTLWLDSDMQFPADTLTRLLSSGKEIVGAAYHRRTHPFDLLCKTLDGKPARVASGLFELAALPLGCMLIHREVFAKIEKPWFRVKVEPKPGRPITEWLIGEDTLFCQEARALGYKIFADTDLTKEVAHIGVQVFKPEDEESSTILAPTGLPMRPGSSLIGAAPRTNGHATV